MADNFSLNFLTAGRANFAGGGVNAVVVRRLFGDGLLVGVRAAAPSLPALARLLLLLQTPDRASCARVLASCSICKNKGI